MIYSLVTDANWDAIFFMSCSEVNSILLITSELTKQNARKALFTCVVYTNKGYSEFESQFSAFM